MALAGPYANLHLAPTDNYASIPPLSFLQAGCPSSAQPTASEHWRHKTYVILFILLATNSNWYMTYQIAATNCDVLECPWRSFSYYKPFQVRFFVSVARRAVPLHVQSFMLFYYYSSGSEPVSLQCRVAPWSFLGCKDATCQIWSRCRKNVVVHKEQRNRQTDRQTFILALHIRYNGWGQLPLSLKSKIWDQTWV